MGTLVISLILLSIASAQPESYTEHKENMNFLIEILKHSWKFNQDFSEEAVVDSETEENAIENPPHKYTEAMYNKISDVNIWMDHFIENITTELRSTDGEFISVPNLNEEISQHVQSIPVKLGMLTSEGTFGELSSLKRAGDASVYTRVRQTLIEVPLVLNKIGVHFEDSKIWYGSIKATDELEVIVPIYEKASLETRFILNTEDGSCTALLDYLKMGVFENLDIIFSDFCLSRASEPINNWVTNYFNVVIRKAIECKLSRVVTRQLQQFDLCSVVK